jgi:DNA-binding NtrC family response regulator
VRQLENAVFRAVVLAEADSIGTAEFPQIAAQLTHAAPPADQTLPPAVIEMPPLITIGPNTAPELNMGTLTMLDEHGEVRPLEEIESDVIRFAITHYRGQMSEVARRLRIGRSTLYRKLEGLGLEDDVGAAERESVAAK